MLSFFLLSVVLPYSTYGYMSGVSKVCNTHTYIYNTCNSTAQYTQITAANFSFQKKIIKNRKHANVTHLQDPYMSELLLHEIVNRMGKDLVDSSDSYIDPMPQLDDIPSRFSLMARTSKDADTEQLDYDALLSGNPNPSLRDQEYLQHSTLWGHHYISGGSGKTGASSFFNTQVKNDATLPAYCNPPNPCPVGYTEEQGCLSTFENTAAFSRDFQAAQECMCDGEHMFDCQAKDSDDKRLIDSDLKSYFAKQIQMSGHKNLVAKKFHPNQVGWVFFILGCS